MYIVFYLSADGDSYSLHPNLDKAKEAFERQVQSWSKAVNNREPVGWDDYKTLLCEIENLDNFGFVGYGDIYGMKLIDSLNWEGDQE